MATTTQRSLPRKMPSRYTASTSIPLRSRARNAVSSSLLRTFHAVATVPLLVPVILPTPELEVPWVMPSRISSKIPLLRRISS